MVYVFLLFYHLSSAFQIFLLFVTSPEMWNSCTAFSPTIYHRKPTYISPSSFHTVVLSSCYSILLQLCLFNFSPMQYPDKFPQSPPLSFPALSSLVLFPLPHVTFCSFQSTAFLPSHSCPCLLISGMSHHSCLSFARQGNATAAVTLTNNDHCISMIP